MLSYPEITRTARK